MLEMVLGNKQREDIYLRVIKTADKIDPKDIQAINLILMEEFELESNLKIIKVKKKNKEKVI